MSLLAQVVMLSGAVVTAAGGLMVLTSRSGVAVVQPMTNAPPAAAPVEVIPPAIMASLMTELVAPATPPTFELNEPVVNVAPATAPQLAAETVSEPTRETDVDRVAHAPTIISPPPVIPPVGAVVTNAPATLPGTLKTESTPAEQLSEPTQVQTPSQPSVAPIPNVLPQQRFVAALSALGLSSEQGESLFEQAQGMTHLYSDLPGPAALAARCLSIIDYEDPGLYAHAGAPNEVGRLLRGLLGDSVNVIWPMRGDEAIGHEIASGGSGLVSGIITPGFSYRDAAGVQHVLRAVVRCDN